MQQQRITSFKKVLSTGKLS